MRAESIFENINFERKSDPKKSLKIGLDCKNYVRSQLEKKGFIDSDSEEEFWDLFTSGFEDWSKEEISNHVIWILNQGNPKNMINYMNAELDNYYEMKKEYGEI